MNASLTAALQYLELGWSPLALCPWDHVGVDDDHAAKCKSPGKAPHWPWKEYQTKRAPKHHLKVYWARVPSCNVGIAMGPVSNLLGLDIDGQAEEALFTDWLSGQTLPNTLLFRTPGGGRRILFAHPDKDICIKTFRDATGKEAIRILTQGSQTVAPPSRHAKGGYYEWLDGHTPDDCPVALCPDWLIARIMANPEPPPPPPAPPPISANGKDRTPEQLRTSQNAIRPSPARAGTTTRSRSLASWSRVSPSPSSKPCRSCSNGIADASPRRRTSSGRWL
jgi:hypothetical protein